MSSLSSVSCRSSRFRERGCAQWRSRSDLAPPTFARRRARSSRVSTSKPTATKPCLRVDPLCCTIPPPNPQMRSSLRVRIISRGASTVSRGQLQETSPSTTHLNRAQAKTAWISWRHLSSRRTKSCRARVTTRSHLNRARTRRALRFRVQEPTTTTATMTTTMRSRRRPLSIRRQQRSLSRGTRRALRCRVRELTATTTMRSRRRPPSIRRARRSLSRGTRRALRCRVRELTATTTMRSRRRPPSIRSCSAGKRRALRFRTITSSRARPRACGPWDR
mmetsp:Transcript_26236/g.86176  ORF Transcript_26236/g.86176 Transcript_26236/m.86176 type:complete len:277 (-) Transcript_26236:1933-2763(-)